MKPRLGLVVLVITGVDGPLMARRPGIGSVSLVSAYSGTRRARESILVALVLAAAGYEPFVPRIAG